MALAAARKVEAERRTLPLPLTLIITLTLTLILTNLNSNPNRSPSPNPIPSPNPKKAEAERLLAEGELQHARNLARDAERAREQASSTLPYLVARFLLANSLTCQFAYLLTHLLALVHQLGAPSLTPSINLTVHSYCD